MTRKKTINSQSRVTFFILLIALSYSKIVSAQVTDSVAKAKADTAVVVAKTDTVSQKKAKKTKPKSYILYAGPNFNGINNSSDEYSSSESVGYHIGLAYRSNKFIYWQLGARFNAASYDLKRLSADSSDNISVYSIDVPVTGGISLLSATNRFLTLRAFLSAMPSFVIDVSHNDLKLSKDHINTFNLYGQAGIGVDFLFMAIEGGYNYGFDDLLKSDQKSNPGQFFINIGFRF